MSIQITTLSNGLRIASDTMPTAQSVSLGIWVGVGTRDEPTAEHGLAHLVEHMVFKGTKRRSAFDISAQMENVGGYLNAYTTREETAYHCRVLPEHVELACDVIADMLQNSVLDPDELTRERDVIIQEIGQTYDTPDDYIFDLVQETAFPQQGIGRSILGSAEMVARIPRDELVAYINDHYTAANMILVAAGQIEHDHLVALGEKYFGTLPSGRTAPRDVARYSCGEARDARDLEQLHLVFGFPGLSHRDPDHYAAQIMTTALGGGMSSRLFQEVREKRGLVYAITAFNHPFSDGGMTAIYAGTDPAKAKELVPVICDEIAKLGDTLTEEEMNRAKAQLRAGMLMAQESSAARAEQLAAHLLIFGRPLAMEERLSKLTSVALDDVRRLSRTLRTAPMTMAALGPLHNVDAADHIVARLRG